MDITEYDIFTPKELDEIRKEMEFLLAKSFYEAETRAQIIRCKDNYGTDTRAVAVLIEAMRLVKDELREKKEKLEVVNTTRNAEHNVAQRLDERNEELKKENENLKYELAKWKSEARNLHDKLVKQFDVRLEDMRNIATIAYKLDHFENWSMASSITAIGVFIAIAVTVLLYFWK